MPSHRGDGGSLDELDGPGVGVDVGGLEPGEAGALCELAELALVPLLAAGVVREHDHVDVEDALRLGGGLRVDRQHALDDDDLAIFRQRVVAVLEQRGAVRVAPVVEDPLHEDGVAGGHGREHVPAHVAHAGERRRLGDDVRQVEVDPGDVRVAGRDGVQRGAHAAAHVHQRRHALEARVEVQQLLGDDHRVVLHALVEHAVEARVRAVVLERRHPVRLVERDAAVQHRVLEIVPALHEDLVLVHEREGGHGHAVLVGGEPLADGRGGVAALVPAVPVLHLAPDDVVGGEQAEHAVHHGRRGGGVAGRRGHPRHHLLGRQRRLAAAGLLLQHLQQAQLDGVLQRHGQDGRRRQLHRVHARLLVHHRGHVAGGGAHGYYD
uniref:Uncharacterized protein n=1 Tax=Zea mays TaxID=4577 RepID=C4J6W8_MAIZE|nr:unknown [Zea mays]